MEFSIELQDHEGVVHREFRSTFSYQDTLYHLNGEVQSKLNIDRKYQELFLEGQRLGGFSEDKLQTLGLKHRSKVVVRHNMVASWKAFVDTFELARQASAQKQFIRLERTVGQALGHLMPLVDAKLLVAYPQFDLIFRQFEGNFSRYMDQEYKFIESAAHKYFSKVFADNPECPTLHIKCEKKGPEEDGVQGGLICYIMRSKSPIGKFYVKEHMAHATGQHADLRELFVYKLLELIGVGPKVHFIPNVHYSSFGLYIGTEEVPSFRRADTNGLEISSEVHAQRALLRRLLFVKDLHSKNYGLNGDGKLSIIDIQIKDFVQPEMVHKYLEGYQSWKGSKEIRIQVAKDCIQNWNLQENFERANTAISMQKELFKMHSVSYKPSRNFDDYFVQINNNLNALMERLK
ncbi:hypothetical protein L3Y34_000792 [Caenorhabditis briggsae]|uniref:Ubiquitin-like domain-containing protein n=1 Tax=Caenorhabditis briggsae TaxID=6238 RepID=A0AAE9DAP7_CAEBR|nr:hypothetical protein L3Y34_000792 [Caenorhabditis briggsae]